MAMGWAMGAEGAEWMIAPSVVAATLSAWLLTRLSPLEDPENMGLAPAHRAWFASSAGCMVVLMLAWGMFGWPLPSLVLDGIRLDPAGALGWDQAWLMPRLSVVQWLLIAGAVGMVVALIRCAWQKKAGSRPRVLLGWTFAPFFWMAALGLLMGVSQPWRSAPSHELAARWSPSLEPVRVASLAENALEQSKDSAEAAVWAHALALKAYQKQEWSREHLDGFFHKLASINATRSRSRIFPHGSAVGVDNKEWCFARAKWPRDDQKPSSHASCSGTPPGRIWAWVAR